MTEDGSGEKRNQAPKKARTRKAPPKPAIADAGREAAERAGSLTAAVEQAHGKDLFGSRDQMARTREASGLHSIFKGADSLGLAGKGITPEVLTALKGTGATAGGTGITPEVLTALKGTGMPGGIKLGDLAKGLPKMNLGSDVVKAITGLGLGSSAEAARARQSYASAQAVITNALEENRASQDILRGYITTRQTAPVFVTRPPLEVEDGPAVELVPDTRLIDATNGVLSAVLSMGETSKEMLLVAQTSLTVSKTATEASAKSDQVIRGLTFALVGLTLVLALPVIASIWHDWIVPILDAIGRVTSSIISR